MENRKITVASSPHIKSNLRVNKIMLDVLIALIPVAAAGIYFNGMKGLFLILTTIIGAMVSEVVFKRLLHKKHSLNDLSAAVTGMILGLILPVTTPLWVAALSSVFAIILVKEIFGGLGQNFMNPAVAAKIFAVVSYGNLVVNSGFGSATFMDRLLGSAGGNLGEASIVAIIVGGIYLAVKGVIRVRVPFTIIVVSLVFSQIVLGDITILGGNSSIYLIAFFLANDYASSAITNGGKWVYALLVGIAASVFIGVGKNIEGAYYAILLGNVFAPFIDTFFKGKVDMKKEATA
ncbi:RnfABCDGE type electron transport complex subunit D [Proteiniclasticum sp.]|uniref:RnfABCDGE type electron transport complex subunit D n=1 Tax=Proteiniclasticum sp. TaxID=2053595 RepID=UPI00289DBC8A|nr:RnfABCDGE type electron transport complex subunit D [Proteiniclasticum sp.]